MEIFVQQLINGITLGSIYGPDRDRLQPWCSAIIGHGELRPWRRLHGVPPSWALITLLIVTSWLGITSVAPRAVHRGWWSRMTLTSLGQLGRSSGLAYRPLRGSFRLAPLISAIGMSIFLMNFVQVAQGAAQTRRWPPDGGGRACADGARPPIRSTLSYKQMVVWAVTAVLLLVSGMWWPRPRFGARATRLPSRTRRWRRCSVSTSTAPSRSPSWMGAALAAVAGTMYLMYYGGGEFSPTASCRAVKAFTAAVLGGIGLRCRGAVDRRAPDRPDRDAVVGLFLDRLQGRRGLSRSLAITLHLPCRRGACSDGRMSRRV